MNHGKAVAIIRTYKYPDCGYTEEATDIMNTEWSIGMISGGATCPECEYTANMPR
jgi:hypothetical protein